MIGRIRRRLTDSLTVRVILLSSLWAVAAFIVVGSLISSLYRDTAEAGFQGVLSFGYLDVSVPRVRF
jgi:hypothetical protein